MKLQPAAVERTLDGGEEFAKPAPYVGAAQTPERHLVQLDGLRAVAITGVAVSHWAPQFMFGIPLGTGVQLFFVISGFLITGILLDNRREGNILKVWRRFYARRTLRIFPLFYAAIGVALILNIKPMRHDWPWHVSYLSNFRFVFLDKYDAPPGLFSHFWSLAVEEQFYLIWPLLALFLPLRFVWIMLLALFFSAPVFRIVMHFFTSDHATILWLPWSNLDALALGGMFAYLIRFRRDGRWNADRLAKICLIVGVPLTIVGTVRSAIPAWVFSLAHTGLVAFYGWMVFKAHGGFGGPMGVVLQNRIIVYLGKISYGLYVIHMFAPDLAREIGRRFDLPALAHGAHSPAGQEKQDHRARHGPAHRD